MTLGLYVKGHQMTLNQISTDRLRIESLTSPDALAGLAGPWNSLAGGIPFRRWEWLEAWWRHYQLATTELFALAVRTDRGELVGLAPWYLERSARAGRVIRFLGSGEVCSEYVTLLAAPENCRAVAWSIADWLASAAEGTWDLIELDGVSSEDNAIGGLVERLVEKGHTVHRRERIGDWRIELPNQWQDYAKRLSRSRRGGLRTLEKRYLETGRAFFRTVERAEQLDGALAVLRDLHQRRRASLGDPGCFASPRFEAFLAEVAHRFFQLGQLRLHWVELDGRPVAAQFDLAARNT
jgi:CelD/BcsL family acetyltransferase involved in cellulose biosynthesis